MKQKPAEEGGKKVSTIAMSIKSNFNSRLNSKCTIVQLEALDTFLTQKSHSLWTQHHSSRTTSVITDRYLHLSVVQNLHHLLRRRTSPCSSAETCFCIWGSPSATSEHRCHWMFAGQSVYGRWRKAPGNWHKNKDRSATFLLEQYKTSKICWT